MKKKLILFLLIGIMAVMSTGCGHDKPAKHSEKRSYRVSPEKFQKTLHFTGTFKPLQENTLTNPIDAVVEAMPVTYGQWVKKGQVMFVMKSAEMQKQYNDTLTEYLKAKDSYTIAQAKFTGTKDLWDAGLLSKNNYLSEKSSLSNARVALEQATRKLSELAEKIGEEGNEEYLSSLNLAEFKKVRHALSKRHDTVSIKAPTDGVLLYPPKSGGDDKSNRIAVGSAVKAGQLIALVGDMRGIRVEIDVPEVDIDKIKPGMKATVRSVAYPKEALHGELVAVNAQASASTGGNNLPTFAAVVDVKNLTAEQKEWVKVGMSATIELSTMTQDKLMVPIRAVQLKRGKSVVYLQKASGQTQEVVITTGAAQADKVVVESGLQAGDVVQYG